MPLPGCSVTSFRNVKQPFARGVRTIEIVHMLRRGGAILKSKSLSSVFAVLLALSIIGTVLGHGAVCEYRFLVEGGVVKIEVHAAYDSGEPMSEAQVVIFSPDDPATPWKTGQADKDGYYVFEPDLSMPGMWAVQMRLAGHGDMLHIEVTGDEASTLGDDSLEPATAQSAQEKPAGGVTDAVAGEEAALSQDLASVVSQEPAGGVAPLVQIVVSDGSVVVRDSTLPTGVESHGGTPGVAGYSTAQIVVMSVCVIWGFVGTALFFAGRRK